MTTATVARRRPTLAAASPGNTQSAPAPVAPPIESARAALSQARLMRAEYLIALAEGLITVQDVIDAALNDDGRPLRRISLRQLLLSQPGWGERRTTRLLSVLAGRMGSTDRPKDMTIAWLLDPRCGGRRYLAWLDVQQAKNSAPWPGFPFAPRKGDDR